MKAPLRGRRHVAWRMFIVLLMLAPASARAQADLPDAPAPSPGLFTTAPDVGSGGNSASTGNDSSSLPASAAFAIFEGQQTFPPAPSRHRPLNMPGLEEHYLPIPRPCVVDFCSVLPPRRACCEESSDSFAEYLTQNAIHIYTPRELGGMAVRGVIDPFNLLTIVGTSAISVGIDSHSPYGPGMMGFAKLSGTTLTEDMTNAFFETFLIPSIDHQDPRFRRMPNASIVRRLAHCIYQTAWTDSDTGKGMFNYSTVVGAVLDEAVSVSYVPFQREGWGADADRIAVNLATTPIGNFVTEFIPDAARHINVNVVILQRVIDRVAIEEGGGTP
jgi:hypothetical protein